VIYFGPLWGEAPFGLWEPSAGGFSGNPCTRGSRPFLGFLIILVIYPEGCSRWHSLWGVLVCQFLVLAD